MSIEQEAVESFEVVKNLLIVEGYSKDLYEIRPDMLRAAQESGYLEDYKFEKGTMDNGICGTKRCLIGAITASRQESIGDWRPIDREFCDSSHESRYSDDAILMFMYNAINEVAKQTTKRRKWSNERRWGYAENYSEHDKTTRADVINLIDRTITRIESGVFS